MQSAPESQHRLMGYNRGTPHAVGFGNGSFCNFRDCAWTYNFCRIHKTLPVTPAMAAGLTSTLHDAEWIVDLIDASAPKPQKPGPKPGTKYRPRISKVNLRHYPTFL